MALSEAQRRFLRLLADEPSIFSWKSKSSSGKIVDAFGPTDNWTHFQIVKRIKNARGQVVARKVATITAEDHFSLSDAGLTAACAITPAGRAALGAGDE